MGSWGTGPFDSDSALDYLGDLAQAVASSSADDDYAIAPGSVDRPAVTEALRVVLTATPAPGEDQRWALDCMYAAAGLVAAALAGKDPSLVSGTRLFAAMAAGPGGQLPVGDDDQVLGLDNHCGFVALLDRSSADALRVPALAAVATLAAAGRWLDGWNDVAEITDQLTRLARVLA